MRHRREAGYGQWLLGAPGLCHCAWRLGQGPAGSRCHPARVAKGTAAMWGPWGATVGAPCQSQRGVNSSRALQSGNAAAGCTPGGRGPSREGQSPRPAGTVPARCEPALHTHSSRSSRAQAAPPASPELQPRHLPPAAVHTTQVPPFIALGRNFIVSKDLLIW